MLAANKLMLLRVTQLGLGDRSPKSMLTFYGKKVHQEGSYILDYPPKFDPCP